MKQVPHSLYQTLNSTKAHPLLIWDLVLEGRRWGLKYLEIHGKGIRGWFWAAWGARESFA